MPPKNSKKRKLEAADWKLTKKNLEVAVKEYAKGHYAWWQQVGKQQGVGGTKSKDSIIAALKKKLESEGSSKRAKTGSGKASKANATASKGKKPTIKQIKAEFKKGKLYADNKQQWVSFDGLHLPTLVTPHV